MNPNNTTIGLDLGDKNTQLCVVDGAGQVVTRAGVPTTREGFERALEGYPPCRIVLEVGTHSRWVAEALTKAGHEVIVANARKLKAVSSNIRKNDVNDAELLARLGRSDLALIDRVHHRSAETQADLARVRARAVLVGSRSKLIGSARAIAKTLGHRLAPCSTDSFHKQVAKVPSELKLALEPVFAAIAALTTQIKGLESSLEKLVEKYPAAAKLAAPDGVGVLTAMTYVLTLENPSRFAQSRDVGAFLGLTPRQDQSGDTDKQLGITKAGDPYLRKLLVQCANYILGPFGKDSDLRRWGLRLAARGGKNQRKRAKVAVARKLAVLLHRLWTSGEEYMAVGYAESRRKATRA